MSHRLLTLFFSCSRSLSSFFLFCFVGFHSVANSVLLFWATSSGLTFDTSARIPHSFCCFSLLLSFSGVGHRCPQTQQLLLVVHAPMNNGLEDGDEGDEREEEGREDNQTLP